MKVNSVIVFFRYVEKGNLEGMMFEITSCLRMNHQKMYQPAEGLLVHEINEAWQRLEQEEHNREVALRDELIRQQALEQIARKFKRKSEIREEWLQDNCKLLKTDNFGEDLPTVEASVKKQEAIETDIKVLIWHALKKCFILSPFFFYIYCKIYAVICRIYCYKIFRVNILILLFNIEPEEDLLNLSVIPKKSESQNGVYKETKPAKSVEK